MNVRVLDPLRDPGWDRFLESQPRASVFHTRAWLDALWRTYKYVAIALTTSPAGEPIENAVCFSVVDSWLTGHRVVSLPFSDHCQPLVDESAQLEAIIDFVSRTYAGNHNKYVEIRPQSSATEEIQSRTRLRRSASFHYHVLDLRPDLDAIFRGFHKSCVQRNIRRAERERLVCHQGTADADLDKLYALLIMTRRRHGLPPQPLAWFRNLRDSFGPNLKVRVAMKDGQPIAAILTIRYRDKIIYKYGCSDSRFHHLGSMPFLFWRAIQEEKELGATELDLGRSDIGDEGLVAFKEHLGAAASTIYYYRYPPQSVQKSAFRATAFAPYLYAHMPAALLRTAGNLIYRHVG